MRDILDILYRIRNGETTTNDQWLFLAISIVFFLIGFWFGMQM